MSSTVEEISIEFEESGQIVVKELDKIILSKGAWSTVLFRYQELKDDGSYGSDKYSIRRYRKIAGAYKQQSKFNISSAGQAQKIVEGLSTWLSENPDAETDI